MMDEAKAEKIRASRGNYEIEITSTGEAGLHQCANLCPKNPGHDNFIPTNNFNIEYLPPRYRDNLLVDWARAQSDLTCRLSGSRISEDRPETWPDSEKAFPFSSYKGENSMMVGTGWVNGVYKYNNNGPCPCDGCHQSSTHTPKMTWGAVYINTANHVIFNTEEARYTKCQFFYDSPETDINTVPTITGLEVVFSDIEGDWCVMKCVTHDVELLDKLVMMHSRWWDLRNKVKNKYWSKTSPRVSVPGVGCDTNVDHDLCIVVSHPHGCTKQISVGTWTQRHVVKKDVRSEIENITYRYNTPTCPGSSGAGVFTLYKDRRDLINELPPHTEGGPGNDNNSGVGYE